MTARVRLTLAGLILAAALAASPARAERLIVSVSNHRVTVTPNYSGEELVLFGSVEKDATTPASRNNYDLVVTVAGPRADMVTRRKERKFGIWINTDSRQFLQVPTSTVIGTSMVLTLVTMVFATMLHAVTNHLVDAVLALILMVGGVTGAQFGARAGQKIRGEHLRLLLGLLVLAVGVRFAVELVIRPEDLFTIRETGGTG